ncbi:hypothetical protein MTBLM1_50149 [Rhodospirillaceae bacterium LM-1]|nr:hypothetical protein MTBLM1_50149 [Rhodospirillaceae bacterium LM-1]
MDFQTRSLLMRVFADQWPGEAPSPDVLAKAVEDYFQKLEAEPKVPLTRGCSCASADCKSRRSAAYQAAAQIRDAAIAAATLLPFPMNAAAVAAAWAAYGTACAIADATICD